MKKLLFLFTIALYLPALAQAQSRKMFVSKHGGEKRLLLLGKVGYDNYYYHGADAGCDTLVCTGVGFETASISKSMFTVKSEAAYVDIYNRLIRHTDRVIRKSKSTEGSFTCEIGHYKASVKYSKADYKKQAADIEIELL